MRGDTEVALWDNSLVGGVMQGLLLETVYSFLSRDAGFTFCIGVLGEEQN